MSETSKAFSTVTSMHSVQPPSFVLGGGSWASHQIFKKYLTRSQTLEGGVTFFKAGGGGGCSFYIKNKLKSKIFNDKKSL